MPRVSKMLIVRSLYRTRQVPNENTKKGVETLSLSLLKSVCNIARNEQNETGRLVVMVGRKSDFLLAKCNVRHETFRMFRICRDLSKIRLRFTSFLFFSWGQNALLWVPSTRTIAQTWFNHLVCPRRIQCFDTFDMVHTPLTTPHFLFQGATKKICVFTKA